jgi:6-phosphogluconate dehydrogenase
MVGGDAEPVGRLRAVFQTLAPEPNRGWGHVGPSGAGHIVKMIHNGIEYGMMQALAEGFALLRRKSEFGLELGSIAEIWRHGSVIRSWLLDLITEALDENPNLEGILPHVADSGEGRWTALEAIDLDLAAPVITLALIERLRSREPEAFADRLLIAMRQRFGGHPVPKD